MNVDPGGFRPRQGGGFEAADIRSLALACMVAALEHLDRDVNISPLIGSQLQLAIDRLSASLSDPPIT
jgi:hypothetical protein